MRQLRPPAWRLSLRNFDAWFSPERLVFGAAVLAAARWNKKRRQGAADERRFRPSKARVFCRNRPRCARGSQVPLGNSLQHIIYSIRNNMCGDALHAAVRRTDTSPTTGEDICLEQRCTTCEVHWRRHFRSPEGAWNDSGKVVRTHPDRAIFPIANRTRDLDSESRTTSRDRRKARLSSRRLVRSQRDRRT